MGRIVSIDFGRKRTGLAVTDPLQLFATALCTVSTHELEKYLVEYVKKEIIETFVIENPKTLKNEDSESKKYLLPFLSRLKKTFPNIPVCLIDERFTSSIAHQLVLDSGLSKKKRQNKEIIDTISATIILQSYLEQKSNNLI
ncbi:MAG: Holliday junction resolvase RuvX [Bacteroidales bacterium]|nr:Holliday junction resolvase RuvX [Bacteroidales bacterium]